ncbi:MAG: hypothetical protein IJR70_04410 [Eubacterium sp.]|nr:hypothetical protein [Eubacterium sp.]
MKTVTICGSMRFEEEMKKIAFILESKQGYNVLQCVYNTDNIEILPDDKRRLEAAHFKKIELSDSVYIVDIGGYIGEQVKKEIEYAKSIGKEIIYHSVQEKKYDYSS